VEETQLTFMTLYSRLQVRTFVCLLAAIAFYVGGSRLAHGATVVALRHRPTFLVDVLEGSV
jgi:hypothetical protein